MLSITEIIWDTDGDLEALSLLPTELEVIENNIPGYYDNDEAIANYLSDAYGFLVKSYCSDPFRGMELGNFFFGNSRGRYRVERHPAQELFGEFFTKLKIDNYGHPDPDSPVYQTPTDRHEYVSNEVFIIRPYYWGSDDKIAALPNFVYKPENTEISWYKYPMRDAYSNVLLDGNKIKQILDHCLHFVQAGFRV